MGTVHGRVTIGPTAPVERAGQLESDRPYQAALAILAPDGQVVARVRSDEKGEFSVELPEGQYRLQPETGGRYPRARPQTAAVRAGQVTEVEIRFDSGIR